MTLLRSGPQLPQEDLEFLAKYKSLNEQFDVGTGYREVLSIITRLQSALELAIQQRNEWSAYAGDYFIQKHMPRDDREIQAALEGREE